MASPLSLLIGLRFSRGRRRGGEQLGGPVGAQLAQHYGLPDPEGFARKFAAYERERLGENANE